MLTQCDVMEAIREFLKKEGYKVKWPAFASTTATHPELDKIILTVHGEEFDAPFYPGPAYRRPPARAMSEDECLNCLARLFYKIGSMAFAPDRRSGEVLGLGLPFTDNFWKHLKCLRGVLDHLNVIVFLVNGDGSVRVVTSVTNLGMFYQNRARTLKA